jgi:hypothetical protein
MKEYKKFIAYKKVFIQKKKDVHHECSEICDIQLCMHFKKEEQKYKTK